MKTILVAEDNDGNYILMTYILKKNYNIVRAARIVTGKQIGRAHV